MELEEHLELKVLEQEQHLLSLSATKCPPDHTCKISDLIHLLFTTSGKHHHQHKTVP